MARPPQPPIAHGVTPEELLLIRRFEATYNALNKYIVKISRSNVTDGFASVVRLCRDRRLLRWDDAAYLERMGYLRNGLAHDFTDAVEYVAVPTPLTVEQFEQFHRRLTQPPRAIPTFQRTVEKVRPEDSLKQVLKLVKKFDYSQFPVYGENGFHGLLTENGITRWLARHVTEQFELVDFNEVTVSEVLGEEENREDVMFVGRNTPVPEIKELFAERRLLEAVLITTRGDRNQALLGIATRWNMLEV